MKNGVPSMLRPLNSKMKGARMRPSGYYWVKLFNSPKPTIGYYDGSSTYPWEVVGSDEIFTDREITVIAAVPMLDECE